VKPEPHVHPAALVETDQIGDGTRIWAFTHILPGASIGANCNIGDHCFVESGVLIGDDVTIKNGNAIWDGVTLEDGVFVGPNVVFTNDLRPRSPRLAEARDRYADRGWLAATVVRHGATLGAGSVIVAGVTIGEFAFVAAGALVTRDVDPHALVVGSPARPRGWVCRCGSALELAADSGECPTCRRAYRFRAGCVELV
jgi:UDP-2-acetamido-3-amino-2,3-dideoxy-glucuronate N-acetyltransferase